MLGMSTVIVNILLGSDAIQSGGTLRSENRDVSVAAATQRPSGFQRHKQHELKESFAI
jgi:hypothetical protein